MAQSPARTGRDEFRFRKLDKPEEFRQVEELQRQAWGMAGESPVPTPIQRAIQDNGGLILGAFADVYLAGFTLGFLGWDGETLYHYSHMTAVRPEYQNHHLGFRLKEAQREEVLRQGLGSIRWTFDPLQSRNAYLNVRRLGGRPDRYYVHYYGQLDSDLNRNSETDRLRLVWNLKSPEVDSRLAGTLPSPTDDQTVLARSTAIITTEPGESGIRIPTEVSEPTGERGHIEIPFDLALVREHEPKSVSTWRHAARDAFRAAFDRDYRVDDFAVVSVGHERRSYYFLSPPPAPSPGETRR